MKLYVVEAFGGWESSISVVRAETEEAARALFVSARSVYLTELAEEPQAGVLWSHEDSPDSDRS